MNALPQPQLNQVQDLCIVVAHSKMIDNRPDEAIPILEKVLAINPSLMIARSLLTQALMMISARPQPPVPIHVIDPSVSDIGPTREQLQAIISQSQKAQASGMPLPFDRNSPPADCSIQ